MSWPQAVAVAVALCLLAAVCSLAVLSQSPEGGPTPTTYIVGPSGDAVEIAPKAVAR